MTASGVRYFILVHEDDVRMLHPVSEKSYDKQDTPFGVGEEYKKGDARNAENLSL